MSGPAGGVSLTDRERLSLAVHGHRVSRQGWAQLHDAHALVEEANGLWRTVKADVDALHTKATREGLERGRANAVAEMAHHLAQAHHEARSLMQAQDARVIDLAVALVGRILPHLDRDAAMRQLLADALQAQQAERFLRVRVHPSMIDTVTAALDAWRGGQTPSPAVQCTADAALDPLGLVVESESGSLRAGAADQLQVLSRSLQRSVGGSA